MRYLLLLAILIACGPRAEPKEVVDLDASRALFAQNADTYRYERRFVSWTGWGYTTKFEVENGVVIAREYESGEDSWSETVTELGTHHDGHAVKTIPELYDQCESEVLTVDRTQNDVTLTFHQNGILEACTYFPKNCADDCATGVTIDSITF
jgi:hypothetical protein